MKEQATAEPLKFLEWTDELSIGHCQIDSQHQILFTLYNNLVADITNRVNEALVVDNLRTFKSHAEIHFKTEETYMKEIGFPELAVHQCHHDELIETLNGLLSDLEQHSSIPDHDLIQMLYFWVHEHIYEEDLVIAAFNRTRQNLTLN